MVLRISSRRNDSEKYFLSFLNTIVRMNAFYSTITFSNILRDDCQCEGPVVRLVIYPVTPLRT